MSGGYRLAFPTEFTQGLNRSGKSGPPVRRPSALRICSRFIRADGSPAKLRCCFGSSLKWNNSSAASPSRRMYDQSLPKTAPSGENRLGIPQ